MVQKLILPINACRLTATYKSKNYKKQMGYTHYGVDMTDKNKKDKNIDKILLNLLIIIFRSKAASEVVKIQTRKP